MARGFESKDVEFQQAEAERSRGTAVSPRPAAAAEAAARRGIELTIARVRHELEAATADAHRRMLAQALTALERQLAAFNTPG
jgi:hypothetical protein